MWILTQNKKRILSTEGMEEISVSLPAEGRTDYAVVLRRRNNGKPFALGFYNKKELAEKILKEIFIVQAEHRLVDFEIPNRGKITNMLVAPKVYEMPKDIENCEV